MAADTGNVTPILSDPPTYVAQPLFSPDGQWLAYFSGQGTENRELLVRPYPIRQSVGLPFLGNATPMSAAWHPRGRELFFLSRDPSDNGRLLMMAVDFNPGPPPTFGRPHELFAFDQSKLTLQCVPSRCYDIAPDGEHFYATETVAARVVPPHTHIKLAQNWFEELKAKVPVGAARR